MCTYVALFICPILIVSKRIVDVLAKDKGTGSKDQSMTIASSGLSDKDIEKMVADAEQFAEADILAGP